MSEALDKTSCISHRQRVHFFVMYEDFLDVAKVSEHQHKLAAFWRVLEVKTNERDISNERDIQKAKDAGLPIPQTELWMEIPYSEFSKRTLGVYKESSFKIAAVESERLGFSKSRVIRRHVNPNDLSSKEIDCKEYLFLTEVMQSALNYGDMPTPVEFDSPLLNGYDKREKKRKEVQKMRLTPVENDSPPVEFDNGGVKSDSPPVEFDHFNNIYIESSSIDKNKEERNVTTDTAHADVSTSHNPLSENKVVEKTKAPETENQVEVDTNPPVKETARKRRTGKTAQSKKNETKALLLTSEIAAPQKPDPAIHPYNGELFMKLADFYRGTELVYSADPKNRYQRAVAASLALVQRNAKFEEVDKVFRFLLGLDEIKDVKWIAGRFHTDLWTVEPHFSKKLLELEDAERTLRMADGKRSEKKETPPQEDESTPVPWTRKGDWEGNPVEHWEQFEIMSIKDAKQYGWTPDKFPRVVRNRILAKLRQRPAQNNVSA